MKTEGVKNDKEKVPLYRGLFVQFSGAIQEVAAVSSFGANKYSWENWRHVSNGFDRYSDALLRHLAKEASGETMDSDSGFLHATHCAWNSLARLELILIRNELLKPS